MGIAETFGICATFIAALSFLAWNDRAAWHKAYFGVWGLFSILGLLAFGFRTGVSAATAAPELRGTMLNYADGFGFVTLAMFITLLVIQTLSKHRDE